MKSISAKRKVIKRFIDQFDSNHGTEFFCHFLEFIERWNDKGKIYDLVYELSKFGYDNYPWFDYDYIFKYISDEEEDKIPKDEFHRLYEERKMQHFNDYLKSIS